MIKAILTALDSSPASQTAAHLSLRLAKLYDAVLLGMGIVNELWISSTEAIPLGGASFKTELDEKLTADMTHQVHGLEKAFQKLCEESDIPCSLIEITGIPSQEIEYFLTEYDLLVIGKDASFHFDPSQETSPTVKQLIKDNPRPLIVTGTDLPAAHNNNVVIAFDGSFQASRALHMAFLLGLLKNKTVHVITVGPEDELVRSTIHAAFKFFQHHGLQAHLHPHITPADPAEVILSFLEDISPSLVVLGAYTHGELNRFIWGSCAEKLLKTTNMPLFFFH